MNNNHAFTLMELMIVIAMIGIVMAVSFPGFAKWRDAHRLSSSAVEVKSALEVARSEAIKHQRTVTVLFNRGTGASASYKVFIDNGSTTGAYDSGDYLVRKGHVSQTVTVDQVAFNGSPSNAVRFNLMGLASETPGSLRMVNSDKTSYKQLTVSSAGLIVVQSSKDGNTWLE